MLRLGIMVMGRGGDEASASVYIIKSIHNYKRGKPPRS
jgi:hypothetical protein